MHIAHEIFASSNIASSNIALPTQTQAEAQAAQREAQAATREAAREAAAIAKEQAAVAKEQAAEAREQAKEFKENLRQQIQSEIDAARGIPSPPNPPQPPDWNIHVGTGGRDFGGIPPQAVDIVSILGMTLVFCVVGLPIARAFARWLDRRGTPVASNPDLTNRLQAIEQAVESVAVEVERISEGQRFTTRVLSERTHEPAADYLGREREPIHVGISPDGALGAPVNTRRN